MNLTLFYHVAAMGNWKEVVEEQMQLIQEVGLNDKHMNVTYVGDTAELVFLGRIFERYSIDAHLCRFDPNIMHYETFAMIEIEAWAKQACGAALYFHTKGVSAPHFTPKARWRRFMQDHLIRDWQKNLSLLETHDVVGVNWRDMPPSSHFCGNFWMARADYLGELENFVQYHNNRGLKRTNCEFWISSAKRPPNLVSLVHRNQDYCSWTF